MNRCLGLCPCRAWHPCSPEQMGVACMSACLLTFWSVCVQAFELARALRNLHPDVKRYKTIAAFEPQALEFLDAVAEQNRVVVPEPEAVTSIQ